MYGFYQIPKEIAEGMEKIQEVVDKLKPEDVFSISPFRIYPPIKTKVDVPESLVDPIDAMASALCTTRSSVVSYIIAKGLPENVHSERARRFVQDFESRAYKVIERLINVETT